MITCLRRTEGVSQARRALAGLALLAGIALLQAGCGDEGGGGGNITEVNQRPVAVLGPDMQVAVGETVTMDGSQSNDPDGSTITYSWSFVSLPAGSNATLSSTTASSISFVADVAGAFVVQLTVGDGEATSAAVECTATATNTAPVADAGPDQDVTLGDVVQLDGSQSSDPNGDALTYAWSLLSPPAGSNAVLSSASVVDPTFTADVAGDFIVELTVSDGELTSNPDQSVISVNTPPVADAGADQNVTVGDVVQLDGSQSSDPDGDALTYAWSMESRPAGSTATLSSTTVAGPTFTADVEGDYVVELTVNDGKASSDPDSVVVHTSPPGPEPGYYSGTTSEGYPVSFRVSGDRSEVESGFNIKISISCSFCTGHSIITLTVSMPITSGSFSFNASRLRVNGNMTSSTSFSGDAAYQAYAPTCGTCFFRNVTWTASWQSAAPPPLVAVAGGETAAAPGVGEITIRTEQGNCIEALKFVRKQGRGN